ncbi:MAG: hypothetical protein K2X57_00710 [Xanthobacteraceae bacterium]|nr:hypothetical protein [Xanthobacteraceae bacterium]
MPKITYTMCTKKQDGTEEVLTRNVIAARALNIALEYGGAGRVKISVQTNRTQRLYELFLHTPNVEAERIMAVGVARSSDPLEDGRKAVAAFGEIFLKSSGDYWCGSVEPDEDYARRRCDEGECPSNDASEGDFELEGDIMRQNYTLFLINGEREEVVASGISLVRAMNVAVEHGGPGKADAVSRDVGPLRVFEIGRRASDEAEFESIASIALERSGDAALDAERATEALGRKLLNDTRILWSGCIETDVAYARRHADRKQVVTSSRGTRSSGGTAG